MFTYSWKLSVKLHKYQLWKCTRGKRQLLHNILFIQQEQVLDNITEKFDIQIDEITQTQATLLHDDIPGYDLPTTDFVHTSEDDDEDVSILKEDNPQIYAYLDNVLVHMIDKQEAAIFKSRF